MRRVRGRCVVLERLMVRNVVRLLDVGHLRCGAALAARRTIGIRHGEIEAALEESPGHAGRGEQIAHVLAAELNQFAGRGGTHVAHRVGIADQRQPAIAVADGRAAGIHIGRDAIGLARNKIDGARRRRPEIGVVGVVAHRVMLRVVPKRGDGIAVVVPHGQSGGGDNRTARRRRTCGADRRREGVHQTVIEGHLLRGVVMILIRGRSFAAIEAEGIGGAFGVRRVGGVGIVAQQGTLQAIHRRRPGGGNEARLAPRIGRNGIGREVVIEGNVLLEDHHQMLDGSGRLSAASIFVGEGRTENGAGCKQSGCEGNDRLSHGTLLW